MTAPYFDLTIRNITAETLTAVVPDLVALFGTEPIVVAPPATSQPSTIVEAPKATEPSIVADAPSFTEVKQHLQDFYIKHGSIIAKAKLTAFNAENVSSLKPCDYAAFVAALKETNEPDSKDGGTTEAAGPGVPQATAA